MSIINLYLIKNDIPFSLSRLVIKIKAKKMFFFAEGNIKNKIKSFLYRIINLPKNFTRKGKRTK